MGIIRQLDYETAVLIAAGEMIERPSSIVKELIENSIDAGATKLTVEIQKGGTALIRCSDNGCGIARDDLPMAIKRNATSKISGAADIDKIMTLGFRGEALASIAVAADLRIRSKRAADPVGNELCIHPGSDTPTISEAPMADGTTVIVENLFLNIPARRKFLKKDVTETMYITDLFERLALSNPDVAMTLIADGKTRIKTPGDGNLKHTIYSIFGSEFASKLIELNYGETIPLYGGGRVNVKVRGYVGTPDYCRATRQNQIFFVNGRHVRNRCIQAALEQGYTSYMEASRFPACVMFVDLPPEFVDVNIHPTKVEVKFVADKPVFEGVYYAVRGALERFIPHPKIDFTGKDVSEVSYEMMKMLNAFTPIEDRGDKTAKAPVYNNQKNVKRGQLSFSDMQSEDKPNEEPGEPVQAQQTDVPEGPVMHKFEMVRRDEPSGPMSSTQEVFLEAIPEELDKKLTLKGGAPVPPQTMYLGDIAPEVEAAVTAPHVKAEPIGRRPRDMTGAEFAEYKRRFEEEHKNDPPAVLLPDVPTLEDIRGARMPEPEPAPKKVPEYKIIGEAFLSYLFIEVDDKVLIIDKHAAHERIIFEDLKANLKRKLSSGEVPMQILLAPLTVELPSALIAAVRDFDADIHAIGFDFEVTARRTVEIRAIPVELGSSEALDVFETVAQRLADGTGSASVTRDTLFEKALYQASCKAAIKIGREYDMGHLKWICDKLLVLDDIKVCPHGRPVAFEMTKSAIERQFKRI